MSTAPAAAGARPTPDDDGGHVNARLAPIFGVGGSRLRSTVAAAAPMAPPESDDVAGDPTRPRQAPATDVGSDDATADRGQRRAATGKTQLVFDDGQRVPLDGTVLLGRDPGPMDAHPAAALVRVDDPLRLLSKTHAAVSIDGDVVWVEDCHSTNGTTIRSAEGDEHPVVGRRRVERGEQVVLGERTFVVEVTP